MQSKFLLFCTLYLSLIGLTCIGTVSVYYIVQFPDHTDQVKVTVQVNATAQNVLEAGANANPNLRFVATYYNTILGYLINKIGNVGGDPNMYWEFLWSQYNRSLTPSHKGVSNFVIPAAGYTICMRYTKY